MVNKEIAQKYYSKVNYVHIGLIKCSKITIVSFIWIMFYFSLKHKKTTSNIVDTIINEFLDHGIIVSPSKIKIGKKKMSTPA